MAVKQFKTESKRLLDLMIHSIYTNREIFLRELISNASDALDKRYFISLTDDTKRVDKEDLKIKLSINKDNRQLIIEDSGVGMSAEELENNLGTIAKSGSLEFKKQLEENKDVDIIGQFGVGFYSAFMVAKKIIVESRSINSEEANCWESTGEESYTITPMLKDTVGTKIILELRDNTEEENFDEFLETYRIKQLVKKYSDYVRYPILMDVEVTKTLDKQEGEEEAKTETVVEEQTLNSMVPIWKKKKSEITDEEYNEFYKSKFSDWQDPLKVIHYTVEGTTSYRALLYIPSKTPFNFYSTDYESGLQLYSKGVFIMDHAKDLLPEYFRFVKGLIDSDDLNLNISREILQQDRQVKALAKNIEKKIKSALEDMLKNDREKYNEFYRNFGQSLKFGVYQDYGMHKELLQDLIMFISSSKEEYTTLKEYVANMKENQKYIYYACGDSIEQIKKLPQIERLNDKGYEVLYCTDDVDEFALRMMMNYDEKEFKSVNQGDLDLDSDEEKKQKEEIATANASLLDSMKEALKDKVANVKISSHLKSHPVCLTSDEGLSLEMEKVLAQNPNAENMKASRILEINPEHPIFETMKQVYAENPELIASYAALLYDQACLIDGFKIDDPITYANTICDLMIKANKK